MTLGVWLVSLACLLLGAPGWNSHDARQWRVPAWVGGVRCSVSSSRGTQPAADGDIVRVDCAETATLSCDSLNAEPFDLPTTSACGLSALPFSPAQEVTIELPRVNAQLEWYAVSPSDKLVRLAARPVSAATQSVRVLASTRHVLRFLAVGKSPVSVVVGPTVTKWTIPSLEDGGELLVIRDQGVVVPKSIHAIGPTTRFLEIPPDGTASLAGLSAGAYQVVPRYEGGLQSAGRPIRVVAGETTLLRLELAELGGAEVVAASGVCNASFGLEVVKAEEVAVAGATVGSDRAILTVDTLDNCRRRIDGLKAGAYRVRIKGRDRLLGESPIRIQVQDVAAVTIAAFESSLSGIIEINSRRLGSGEVRLVERDGLRREFEAAVVSGVFDINLPGPGEYDLSLIVSGRTVSGLFKTVTLVAGENRLNWNLTTGTVRVAASGWEGDSVMLSVVSNADPTRGRRQQIIRDAVTEFANLAEGAYTVSAAGRLVAAPTQQVVVKAGSEPTITLRLERSSWDVVVVDDAGLPAPRVAFSVPESSVRSDAPGHYVLSGLTPGSAVVVRAPGFAPTCRTVSSGPARINLEPGRPLEVTLMRAELLRQSIVALDLPGTSCPVPFSAFERSVLPQTGNRSIGVLFGNFPPVAAFTIRYADQMQRVSVIGATATIR